MARIVLRQPIVVAPSGVLGILLLACCGLFIQEARFLKSGPAVRLPSSLSSPCLPSSQALVITLDAQNQLSLSFGVESPATQLAIIEAVARLQGITFSKSQRVKLQHLSYLNQPVERLPAWLDASPASRRAFSPGLPISQLPVYLTVGRQACLAQSHMPIF